MGVPKSFKWLTYAICSLLLPTLYRFENTFLETENRPSYGSSLRDWGKTTSVWQNELTVGMTFLP